MLIGIDGNEANVENRVGVNTYAFELLKNIHRLEPQWGNDHQFIVYLRQRPMAHMPKETKAWKYKVLAGRGMWVIRKLMPHIWLSSQKPDVLFSPSHYLVPFARIPQIMAVMDLGYLDSKGQFKPYDYWQLKLWTAWSLSVSKHILAISQATKKDIVKHYPKVENKISVTQLGYDSSTYNLKKDSKKIMNAKKAYKTSDKYILFLGTLKPSKNIERILEAWSNLENYHSEYKLVIAGKKGWLYESIFEKTKKLGVQGSVVFTGFVPEADKPHLIKGAKLFLMPSLWEGFGLDALSAFASGVPVVLSNRGSLPEVSGNAGVVVDPEEPKSVASGIENVLSASKPEYNKLVKKGIRQASKFSWEKAAKETLKVITNV